MKVRVRVGKSWIAGQGLFTAQDIKQDTRIIQYIGERISKAESAKRIDEGNVYIFTVLLTQFGNYLSNYMISLVHNIDIANLWEIYHLDPLGGSRHAYNPEEPSGRRETSILCWKKGA